MIRVGVARKESKTLCYSNQGGDLKTITSLYGEKEKVGRIKQKASVPI